MRNKKKQTHEAGMEIKFQSVKPLSNHTVIKSWLIIVFTPTDSKLCKVAPERS